MIIKSNKVLKQKDFKTEKELQKYIEQNMQSILKYEFIETEFTVGNFRIDSLAYDKETNAFRIIEYKNIKNGSLVDQGYTYLKVMLERKADFVLKYNEKTKSSKKINEIDWSQSRIVFVSPVYTPYQLNATDFKNIPVDLVKVTRFEEDIIEIDFIQKISNVKVDDVQTKSSQNGVAKEVVVYTEEDHLNKTTEKIKELYEMLKSEILNLGDIDIDYKKFYIAFKGNTNIADVEVYNSKLKLYLNMKKGTLKDPYKITIDMSKVGHHANGDYAVEITSEEDIDNALPLIKQSLKINKK